MKINKTLTVSLIIFSLLTIPFINSIPYLDGNIDFVKSHDFFVGGFGQLLNNWLSVHPPVKEIITFIFFVLKDKFKNDSNYGVVYALAEYMAQHNDSKEAMDMMKK